MSISNLLTPNINNIYCKGMNVETITGATNFSAVNITASNQVDTPALIVSQISSVNYLPLSGTTVVQVNSGFTVLSYTCRYSGLLFGTLFMGMIDSPSNLISNNTNVNLSFISPIVIPGGISPTTVIMGTGSYSTGIGTNNAVLQAKEGPIGSQEIVFSGYSSTTGATGSCYLSFLINII